jgi:MFS family permease
VKSRVVHNYYGFQIFFPLLIWVPIFYEFQRRTGLSDTEIFNIQSIYYLVFSALEIPTGFFADKKGYRASLILGAIILVAANIVPVALTTFIWSLLHWCLIALSRALISGAASAYLYDFLDARGERDEYRAIEGRARALTLVARVVAWSAAGFLMEWNLSSPYILTAAAATLSVWFAMRLPADAPSKGPKHSAKSGPRFPPMSVVLVLVMLQGVGIFVFNRITQVNMYQPLLKERDFAVETFGAIMAAMTIVEAYGAAHTSWLQKRMQDVTAVTLLTLIIGASLVLVGLSGQTGALVGLMIFAWASGVAFPVQRQLLNDVIPDRRWRATLLSVESIVDRLFSAVLAWAAGIYVFAGQASLFLVAASILFIMLTGCIYATLRFNRSFPGPSR